MVDLTPAKHLHMKTHTLLLVAVIGVLPATLRAQQPVNLDDLENRRGVYLQRPSFEPYTGPVVSYHENGRVAIQGELVAGRWEGVRESFYGLGTLKAREEFRNGVLHGPFEAYFKKGAPSDKGTYANGRLDGPYESFWLKQPAEVGAFSGGRMCGEWVTYYPRSSYGLRVESVDRYDPCPSQ